MDWLLLIIIVALVSALLISIKSLSDLRHKNHDLETHVDLLHKAVSAADAGTFYYHIDNDETVWDERSLAMFGLAGSRRAITPGTWERLIHPEDRERAISNMASLLGGKGKIFKHKYRIVRPNREIRWVSASGYIIRRGNRPVEVTGFHFDVTKQILHEQVLEKSKANAIQSMNAKARFLANMSHEIRTPMNAIMGVIELLEDESTADQQPYIQTLRNSSDVLLRIINDVLDISKIEAGKLKLEQKPFNVREVVRHCFDLNRQRSLEKNILLTGRVDSKVPDLITGDSARLQQVLMNLLGNALKFTESGEVLVRLVPDGQNLIVAVSDTGIGISEEYLPDLFDRFSQADTSTTRKYAGTGLGLAIVKDIVELWGGSISVSSRLGAGTAFTFSIPLSEPVRTVMKSADRVLLCTPSKTLQLLWIEDTRSPEVVWVRDWSAFDQALRTDSFDRVVVDCSFPDVPAGVLIDRARQTDSGMSATVFGCEKQVERAVVSELGAQTIAKPLLVSELFGDLAVEAAPRLIRFPKLTSPDFSTLRVLAVDDNSTNLFVLSGLLKRFNIDCTVAESGYQAVSKASENEFDVIFMDYDMPEMDGLEATQKILEVCDTLVIGLSAHVGELFEQEALAAGMSGFLTKPISSKALERILRQHFASAGQDSKAEAR